MEKAGAGAMGSNEGAGGLVGVEAPGGGGAVVKAGEAGASGGAVLNEGVSGAVVAGGGGAGCGAGDVANDSAGAMGSNAGMGLGVAASSAGLSTSQLGWGAGGAGTGGGLVLFTEGAPVSAELRGGASDQVGTAGTPGGGSMAADAAAAGGMTGGGRGAGGKVGAGAEGYVCRGRSGASYETGVRTGVSSRRGGAMYGAGDGGAGASAAGAVAGRKDGIAGTSLPPARVASSDWAAICLSGASSGAAISRRAPWARSADGPIAPLAIERIVTTRPGGMLGGAGDPAGSTPNAAQTAIPHDRTSARRSLCDGAPRAAAAGCPARRTSPFGVTRTAVAPNPPIAMPVSWSAATPDSTAAPSAAAAGGVNGPRPRIELSGVPSFGSTATQIPLTSVPHASTGDSAGCRRSKSR